MLEGEPHLPAALQPDPKISLYLYSSKGSSTSMRHHDLNRSKESSSSLIPGQYRHERWYLSSVEDLEGRKIN